MTNAKGGPEVLLAKPWPVDLDPRGWWMSEKLDGVRAYWDGEKFWSRLGGTFDAPPGFTGALPKNVHLDGELFGGRGKFQETISIVRTTSTSSKYDPRRWYEKLKFVVFDVPSIPEVFESRLEGINRAIGFYPFAKKLPQTKCLGFDHLREELAKVEKEGGEGLMLRQPGSLYERKRSSTLLKVKTFHDAEAVVVGHEPGKGKHKGRLGALVCRIYKNPGTRCSDDIMFNVGTGFSDAERESPPTVGSIVTYRFQELTDAGVPRFPSFVRVRGEF